MKHEYSRIRLAINLLESPLLGKSFPGGGLKKEVSLIICSLLFFLFFVVVYECIQNMI